VVNKADHPGADQLCVEVSVRVEQDLHIKPAGWSPCVVKTVAVEDQGVDLLVEAIDRHRQYLEESGQYLEKRRERTRQETLRMVHNELFRIVRQRLQDSGRLDRLVEDILDRKRDPYSTMREIVNKWLSFSHNQKEAS